MYCDILTYAVVMSLLSAVIIAVYLVFPDEHNTSHSYYASVFI